MGVRVLSASAVRRRAVLWVALAACLLTFGVNAFWRSGYTGDEGFYGVTAENMLRAPKYWLRLSYFPLGHFSADKNGFAHPPFNSYFYAVGLWFSRGSLVGPEIVNLLALGALLFFAYRLLARVDEMAAGIAVLLLAASPAMTGYYSMLEAEPLLATFGVVALYCCLRGGFQSGQRRWLFLGGLSLGMSFALKLWLCGPDVLAVAAALWFRAIERRLPWRSYAAGLALAGVGFVLPAGLHLGAIALVYPQDLGFWLKNIYFGVFTEAGISGSKFTAQAIPANWIHPVWYYAAVLYRDEFFVVPALLLGAGAAWVDSRQVRHLVLVLAAGLAGVGPLSLIKVKEPLYVLTCAIFLYLLAGVCLAAALRRIGRGAPLDRFPRRVGVPVMITLLLAVPAAYLRGVQPDKLTLPFVVAHSVVYLGFLALVAWGTWTRGAARIERVLVWACAATVVATFGWNVASQRPRDAAIARLLKPYVALNRPDEMSMFASNFKNYQYYTFSTGCYWHDLDLRQRPETVLAQPKYRHVRVFILSPESWQAPAEAAWVAWLENHATDKTAELNRTLGAPSGYHVFVRDLPAGSLADRGAATRPVGVAAKRKT